MPRCQTWRPVLEFTASHRDHEPGRCHTCWRPCREKVEPGVKMCATCESLLAQHPAPRVRAELARQSDTSEETLRYLVSDGDFSVALAATNALQDRDGTHLFTSTAGAVMINEGRR